MYHKIVDILLSLSMESKEEDTFFCIFAICSPVLTISVLGYYYLDSGHIKTKIKIIIF